MANKWHVGKDGVKRPCEATVRECGLLREDPDAKHFSEESEANAYVESMQNEKYGLTNSFTRSKKPRGRGEKDPKDISPSKGEKKEMSEREKKLESVSPFSAKSTSQKRRSVDTSTYMMMRE